MHNALSDVVSLHPPFDLVWFDFLTPYAEFESRFARLNKVSLLAMSDDGLHLVWFDVLVELPLGQTRPVLAYSENAVSLDAME